MKYIPMNRRGLTTVKLPSLNGGVNLYDIPTEAADNQLTACENVWWYKGALRTRPGVKATPIPHMRHDIEQMINEREMLVVATLNAYLQVSHIHLQNGRTNLGPADSGNAFAGGAKTLLGYRVPSNSNDEWNFLLDNGKIIQGGANETAGLKEAEPYIPTVLINGYGSAQKPTADVSADIYEDYNMLTRAYTCLYTTDGESQYWPLPEKNLGVSEDGTKLAHVELTMEGGGITATYKVDLPADGTAVYQNVRASELGVSDTEYQSLRIMFSIDPVNGYLITRVLGLQKPQGSEIPVEVGIGQLPRVTNNNLKVTVWRAAEHDKNRDTICKMTRCTWYGGSRSGLAGGSRLFVCGNPDEPNLLHWSGIQHPLYFPEHNYARVGNGNEAITAFGKQGELLILFKEHQMYAVQYVAGDEDDYDYAQENGVPITTYMAMFPVTPLHDSIGCDCPDTVRLVNNRLVWANSNGHVYMLTATNQFSERNVRDISRNIAEDMAAQGEALKTAVSGEYEGYYMLAVGQRVYLLDTQNSAFASFNYYSSEDTARKALPWYIWQLPINVRGMISDGHRVLMLPDGNDYLYEFGGDTDDGNPIPAHFATKMFDFGMKDRTKSVGQIYIGAHVVPEGSVALTYLSEKGNRRDPYEIDGGELAAMGNEGGLRSMRLTPHTHLIQTFGIRVDATAAMAVDGITIKVKQQGVVR